jgi:uncharacterized protein (TIGR03067 family)
MNPSCRLSLICFMTMSTFVPFYFASDQQDKEIERLVKQLGSEVYKEREAASEELEAVGEPALGALRKAAASSDDPEIRRRAEQIIQSHQEKVVQKELERLQGVWKPVSAEYGGKKLDPKEDDWTLKIAGNKIVQLRKGKVHVEAMIQIEEPMNDSKRAHWKYTNANVTDSVIYFFSRDTLVACRSGKEGAVPDWPTRFATNAPGGGTYLVVWKREK